MLIMVGIQNTDPAAHVLATRSGVALEIASLTPPPPAATTGHHTNKANTDIGAGVGRGWVGGVWALIDYGVLCRRRRDGGGSGDGGGDGAMAVGLFISVHNHVQCWS